MEEIGEGTFMLATAGACVGGAVAALWWAGGVLFGFHVPEGRQVGALVVAGAILTPVLVYGVIFWKDWRG